jgi:transposase
MIESFVQASTNGPQEKLYPRREVVNAILYIQHTGVQWRYMPHDLPDCRTWKEAIQSGLQRRGHPRARGVEP